jgi:hypothetical protein
MIAELKHGVSKRLCHAGKQIFVSHGVEDILAASLSDEI